MEGRAQVEDVVEAARAGLLVAINAVAVVLASMATFLLGGLRPRTWWREERARSSARRALLVLVALLLVLAGLVMLSTHFAELAP